MGVLKKFKEVSCSLKIKSLYRVLYIIGLSLFVTDMNSQELVFEKQLDEDNPLQNVEAGSGVAPISVDIDNDEDYDLFIGTNEGTILYYKNVSTEENPDTFEEQVGANNPFNGVDFGTKASPFFVDIDNDGDYDIFIGSTNAIHFYKNEGTSSSYLFIERTGELNPLSEVTHDTSRSFSPTFVDIDNDDDYDVFIGWVDFDLVDSQGIMYYKNTGTREGALFVNQEGEDNPFQTFNELYPNPIFADVDADGDQDVFIGKGDGTVDYYENQTNLDALNVSNQEILGFSVYPNPAKDVINFTVLEEDIQIRIYNLFGQKIIETTVTPTRNRLDIGSLKTGIYLISAKSGDIKVSRKLIVSN